MTFEDFERGLVAVVVVGSVLAYGAGLLRRKPARAEKAVLDWARRSQLPRDDERFAEAVQLRIRRARWSSVGGLLGILAGTPALLVNFGFVGVFGFMAGAAIGHDVGDWCAYARDRRRLPTRSRRLGDYLSHAELGLEAGGVVLGISALVVMVATMRAGLDRSEELLLIGLAVIGVGWAAAAVLAQRWVVRLDVQADSFFAIAWEDAHRTQLLRELTQSAYRCIVLAVLAGSTQQLTVERHPLPLWVELITVAAVVVLTGLPLVSLQDGGRPARLRASER